MSGKHSRNKGNNCYVEKNKYRRWTKEENNLLKKLYNKKTNKELAILFNRKLIKITRRAMRLGLKKNKNFIKKMISVGRKKYLSNYPCILERNPNWKGGKRKKNNYTLIKLHNHPFAFKDNYYPYHRHIVESYIMKYLSPEQIVHHIDGNKNNNDIKNLYIFSSNSEHASFHCNVRYKHIKNNLKSNLDQYVS